MGRHEVGVLTRVVDAVHRATDGFVDISEDTAARILDALGLVEAEVEVDDPGPWATTETVVVAGGREYDPSELRLFAMLPEARPYPPTKC